jgi:hypothetical protein
MLHIGDGFWERFVLSPERQAQIDKNRISYLWDHLIEKFTFHEMTGTQYFKSGRPLKEQEVMYRLLAAEPRTRRRLLAVRLREVLERSVHSQSPWDARVIMPSHVGDPHYVFLFFKRREGLSDEEYRKIRLQLLLDYCQVVKIKYQNAQDVIGFATEGGRKSYILRTCFT